MFCTRNPSSGECRRCGRPMPSGQSSRRCVTVQDRARAIHLLTQGTRIKVPRPRLGDNAAKALSLIGITEDRVKRFFGIKECGCAKRRKTLNDVSEELAFRVESFLNRSLDFFIGEATGEEAERLARELSRKIDYPSSEIAVSPDGRDAK